MVIATDIESYIFGDPLQANEYVVDEEQAMRDLKLNHGVSYYMVVPYSSMVLM